MANIRALTVDGRGAPLGIDSTRPEVSWKIDGDFEQKGYRLQVATDEAFGSVVWDSGDVPRADRVGIPLAGVVLSSRTRYHWRVRAELVDGSVTDWARSWFETGLLSPADWIAAWVTRQDSDPRSARTLYFEGTVRLGADVVRARAYATALGWYRLYVNGADLTGPALVPRWTPFQHYTEYQVYDVTEALRGGDNLIELVVSEGRYRGRLGNFSQAARYGDRLAALVQVVAELADGTTVTFGSDESWRVGFGRILTADPKDGERVDFRIPARQAGLPPQQAQGAVVIDVETALIAESVARVTEIDRRRGTITRTPSGAQVVDFGQNFSGIVRVRLSGDAGQTARLLYSEVADADGDIVTGYLGAGQGRGQWFQRDEIVLAGEPVEYESTFTVHGFRYLSIEGPVDAIGDDEVEAIVLSSDLPSISSFACSDPRLEKLWSNVRWSLRSNFTDTPTDCPTRERSGWTGDIQVFGATASQLVDADAYLRRYLRNTAAEQYPDGRVPPVIPAEDVLGRNRNPLRISSTSVGWGDVTVLLPWTLYRYYGNPSVLRAQYDSARRWVDHLAHRAATRRGLRRLFQRRVGAMERYILDTGYHWGEWLRPGEAPGAALPGNFTGKRTAVATAYLAHSAAVLAQMAEVIGETADAEHYHRLAEMAAEAWRAAYVSDGGSRIADDKQDDYVRGLAFHLLRPEQREGAASRLVELVEATDHHIGTGFLSTPMLLQTLVDAGYEEVAYRVLLQSDDPSWLGQVARGATTTWETWEGHTKDGRPTSSHNHYAFGAVVAFLQERVAGLAPLEPGYRTMRIAPVIGGGLTSASVIIETPYGRAGSAWRIEDGQIILNVEVPNGSAAVVECGGLRKQVGPGRHLFTASIDAVGPVGSTRGVPPVKRT